MGGVRPLELLRSEPFCRTVSPDETWLGAAASADRAANSETDAEPDAKHPQRNICVQSKHRGGVGGVQVIGLQTADGEGDTPVVMAFLPR